ncbi:MAG: peptidyl-prolyl cis-trans isomerase [Phycisphaerae bacterium]|nr:peptidyl-prolyl cis-trans isomerase [Phycisphaerae bacterium]
MQEQSSLNFSVPEKKAKSTGLPVVIVLLVCVIAAQVGLFFVMKQAPVVPIADTTSHLSADQTRELATKLAQRSLYDQAADTWETYIAHTDLSRQDQAKALFQVALMLEKAEQYDRAIAYLYRSELTAKVPDLATEIDQHVKTCFEKLGRFSALRYELMQRTSLQNTPDAAAKVLAEIGPEKITEADLTAQIESMVDSQLAPMQAYMSPDQMLAQKKRMLEQVKTSQAKQDFLNSYLAQEILYREAVADNLLQDASVKSQLNTMTRSLLAQTLLQQALASKINITDSDLQTYYAAHQDQYKEPQKARIARLLADTQDSAKALIAQFQNGEDFDALVLANSKDDATKTNKGVIDADVIQGSPIPTIGNVPDLNQAIFAALPNAVLETPFKSDHGWEVVKVLTQQPARQKTFEEVSQEVLQALTQQKQQEVQQDLIQSLMDKYHVVIHAIQDKPETPVQP